MMVNLEFNTLLEIIDQLKPQKLIELRDYVEKRAQTILYELSPEHLKAIDEAMRPVQEDAANMT